jgi:putative glycosyltransferase (TIGR04372 family)
MIDKFIDYLKKSNRLIAGGMFFYASPGHMLAESDYLLRKMIEDPLVRAKAPMMFLVPTPFTVVIADLLKQLNVTSVLDPNAHAISREIQTFYPELVYDVGVAHFKLTPPPGGRAPICMATQLELAWAIRRDQLTQQWVRMYKAWNATRGRFPLREALDMIPCDPAFEAFLPKKKYAVLQIKTNIVNGTVRVLTPDFFFPTLEMLRDKGYAVVLVGREKMPEEFKRYDVLDYAGSKFASPRNDFYVFRRASIGVASPSGAGYFCDAMGVPLCQYAPWTLQPHPGERTIMVPSRIRRKESPAILTFSQQIATFLELYDEIKGPGIFHPEAIEDIPPTAEDIRAGVEELFNDELRTSPLAQKQAATIRSLDKGGMWETTASTVASTFLTSHPEYLA